MTDQTQAKPQHASTSAATDIEDFVTSLDGGQLERKLSIAVSQVAAASVDNQRKGEVTLKFTFNPIAGTSQVHVAHDLKFTRPTRDGTAIEHEKRSTPMHVGKFGKLTLAPENQLSFLDKTGAPKA